MKNDYEVYDSLSLDAEETAVERDGDDVVTGWRLLKCGENKLYKCSRRYVLNLTPEMLSGAVALQQEKGEALPIDFWTKIRKDRPIWEQYWRSADDLLSSATEEEQASLTWSNWPLFTVGLVKRGYSDKDIVNIIGGNVLRVCKETLAY